MRQLTRAVYKAKSYTPRIIQFGEGNFLRAFMDWQVQQVNKKTNGDWGVTVVRPINMAAEKTLRDQDGLYTVLVQGLDEQGKEFNQQEVIECVCDELSPYQQFDAFLSLALNTDYQVIFSNTTEAGIAYDEACQLSDSPAASFPAKLTQLLWHRFDNTGKTQALGFQIFPCELIDNNAQILKKYVLRYAKQWNLCEDFASWVETKNTFFGTLVDRIVPGYPAALAEDINIKNGYEDSFIVATEFFYSLVVEKTKGGADPIIPFVEAGLNVVVTDNLKSYKEQKVAILNGAHTVLAPIALIKGEKYVNKTLTQKYYQDIMESFLTNEVLPYISQDSAKAKAFADSVLQRFSNPYIQHAWYDISLNSIAKFRARNLPRFMAYLEDKKTPPPVMSKALAAWYLFYTGQHASSAAIPARDSDSVLEKIKQIKQQTRGDLKAGIKAFLSQEYFWGQDLATPQIVESVYEAAKASISSSSM